MGNNLPAIKQSINSAGSIQLFMDCLPSALGKHAKELATRYTKMVYTEITLKPALQSCSIPSLMRAASQAASLDLPIDARGQAYLVPYKNKGVQEAQFQIGYLGLIELAFRSGKVNSISAHCVYESEKDSVKIQRVDGKFFVEHPFSYEMPKGKVIAVYASADVKGAGSVMVVLRADEIEKFRKMSKAPNSPAWKDHFDAMAKKTAIRQLAKFLPKSVMDDFSRAAAQDEREDFEAAQERLGKDNFESLGKDVMDVEFEKDKPETTKKNTKKTSPKDKGNQTTEKKDEKPFEFDWQCKSKKCGVGFDQPKNTGPDGKVPVCPKCGSLQIEMNPNF